MDTRILIYRPNQSEPQETIVDLPAEPTNAHLDALLIPIIFEGQEVLRRKWKEHVTVFHDGKRRDMFVDEEGHWNGAAFNLAATRVYHAASIARGEKPNGAGIIEGAWLVVGVAVLFPDRQVWF